MGENKITKSRLTFRPSDETRQRIEQWYKADNCSSLNDFIEKAVNDTLTDWLSMTTTVRSLSQSPQPLTEGLECWRKNSLHCLSITR